ncbi:hypothetical protein IFM89_035299 [Coptis chinensis]|uniref:Uncharacterized protein n=1 Tax=Coptis chinensis TaxID=261450 RepID=A0A835M2K3_9MAGN|nr:hypothetical protein IFM89_035299 [Coptis chinensis]
MQDLRGFNQASSHRTSFSSSLSDFDHLLRKVEPAYSFVGMHYIFGTCKSSVDELFVSLMKYVNISSLDHLTDVFVKQMGLSDQDIVALFGGHTLDEDAFFADYVEAHLKLSGLGFADA